MKQVEQDIFKKTEKVTRSLKIYKGFYEQFEIFQNQTVGGIGEQVSAGLMAYMALYRIDANLATGLMDPNLTTDDAAVRILQRLTQALLIHGIADLSPEQREQIIRDAAQSKEKAICKK